LLAHAERVAEVVAAGTRGHLAMKLHVAFQFAIEAAAVDQIADAAEKLAHDGPPVERDQAVRKMSWMAWVTRS